MRAIFRKGKNMNKKTQKQAKPKMVRCTFELREDEAQAICEARCEPKPSTAAAQIVRLSIRKGKAAR
jgi:hypothetical protein